MKQNKKAKIYAVFCFAGKRKLVFYILRCDCEAKASKLLAQVPPSLVVSAGKLLYSKRLCGLAPPLCCALSSSSCVCVRALFQVNFIALERALQTAKTELTKEREEAEGRTTAAREALGMAIRHRLSSALHCAFAWYTY